MDAVTCFIVIARIIHYFLKCEMNMQALPSLLGSRHLKAINSMSRRLSKGELQIVKVGIHCRAEIVGVCLCCYFLCIAIVRLTQWKQSRILDQEYSRTLGFNITIHSYKSLFTLLDLAQLWLYVEAHFLCSGLLEQQWKICAIVLNGTVATCTYVMVFV